VLAGALVLLERKSECIHDRRPVREEAQLAPPGVERPTHD
jgi:hypothetical protein